MNPIRKQSQNVSPKDIVTKSITISHNAITGIKKSLLDRADTNPEPGSNDVNQNLDTSHIPLCRFGHKKPTNWWG